MTTSTTVACWPCSRTSAPSVATLGEGRDPRDRLTEDQRVHLVRALVREHGLEVVGVAQDRILERDAVGAEHGAGAAGHLHRGRDVVVLAEGDLLGTELARVLQPPEVERQQRALPDLDGHLGELGLRELEARDRLAELLARARVVERRLIARARRARGAPDDPEAR